MEIRQVIRMKWETKFRLKHNERQLKTLPLTFRHSHKNKYNKNI